MTWLGDCVFSIREAATLNLRRLTENFGDEWARNSIIPKVLSMCRHPNYLYRMTTLFAVSTLTEVASADVIATLMLPCVLQMAEDTVPNVRFNVARVLGDIAAKLDKSVVSAQIEPVLNALAKVSDG